MSSNEYGSKVEKSLMIISLMLISVKWKVERNDGSI